jgi:hypothetical protein
VVPTCNPRYLEGWDREDNSSRPAWEGRWQDPISTSCWVHWGACHPRLRGRLRSGLWFQVIQGKKKFVQPHFKGKELEWWHAPGIPVTMRSLKYEGVVRQDPNLKITRAKRVGGLGSTKPWVQTPVLQNNNNKKAHYLNSWDRGEILERGTQIPNSVYQLGWSLYPPPKPSC